MFNIKYYICIVIEAGWPYCQFYTCTVFLLNQVRDIVIFLEILKFSDLFVEIDLILYFIYYDLNNNTRK